MSLFAEYVQPLTNWLQNNPNWALLITFLISLSESLAIIGSIVPGSVTMTAIGILAGSGIMPVNLTLLAAILGAVAGDSLSYAIGYIYSERLIDIWPFKKYPHWLQYGKDFFALHGGKSVLIGRFIGPLRSITPIIAGILRMPQWSFLIANILSAIGWSLLYVMPGVLIGTASHDLSPERATHLFVLILILLAVIWVLGIMLKWLLNVLNSLLKRHLHPIWLKLKNSSSGRLLYDFITPPKEETHDTTALLAFISLLCFFCFITVLGFVIQGEWLNSANIPTHLFIQSFHTVILEAFFIFCTQLTSTLTISCLFIISCAWFIYYKNSRAILYLSGLIILSSFVAFLLSYYVDSPRPPGLLVLMDGSSFPAVNLMVATAVYGFILFYINNGYLLFTNILRTVLITALGLSGFGAIYLGDYWLADVLASYFAGAFIGLIFYLTYRKNDKEAKKIKHGVSLIASLFLGIILPSILACYVNFHKLSYNHTPYHKEFSLSEANWWNQNKPILPVYRLNRIGKRTSLLNIEYSGNLQLLEEDLQARGWESQSESFFNTLLMRISRRSNEVKLSLLPQLYNNKVPTLIMTYKDIRSKLILELRIWESNYNLTESNKPLWIGSIHPSAPKNHKHSKEPGYFPNLIDPILYLAPSQNLFELRKITLPETIIKRTTYPTQPYILLIKKN